MLCVRAKDKPSIVVIQIDESYVTIARLAIGGSTAEVSLRAYAHSEHPRMIPRGRRQSVVLTGREVTLSFSVGSEVWPVAPRSASPSETPVSGRLQVIL